MTVSLLIALAMAAPEPVVWTKMADPDPTYVAPKVSASPKRKPAKAGARRGTDPDNLDSAVVNLMQAAGEADEAIMRDYERQVRELEERADRARRAAEPVEESSPQ